MLLKTIGMVEVVRKIGGECYRSRTQVIFVERTYRLLPKDGKPPETALTLPLGRRLRKYSFCR
jgi:hypothetical protein